MQPFTFFISYRRQDTAPIALLLKYEVEKRLQFVRVSVDVEEIQHGDMFPDRIKELIDKAHATIVLIGKNWMPRRSETPAVSSTPKEVSESTCMDKDWVVAELIHSGTSPIDYSEDNRYGLAKRAVLPIFVDCERRFDQFDIPKLLLGCSEVTLAQTASGGGARKRKLTRQPNAVKPRDGTLLGAVSNQLHQSDSGQDPHVSFNSPLAAACQAGQLQSRARPLLKNQLQENKPPIGQGSGCGRKVRKPDLPALGRSNPLRDGTQIFKELSPGLVNRTDSNDDSSAHALSSCRSLATSRPKSTSSCSTVVNQ